MEKYKIVLNDLKNKFDFCYFNDKRKFVRRIKIFSRNRKRIPLIKKYLEKNYPELEIYYNGYYGKKTEKYNTKEYNMNTFYQGVCIRFKL